MRYAGFEDRRNKLGYWTHTAVTQRGRYCNLYLGVVEDIFQGWVFRGAFPPDADPNPKHSHVSLDCIWGLAVAR